MTSSVEFVAESAWPAPWPKFHHDEKESFVKARELTLNIVQWLARIANSYVADRSTKDRLTLDFRTDGSFVTKTFEHGLALELRLPSLEMQFQERGKLVPHILDPEERSPAEVEAWILVELLHRGLDRDKFSKSLPYTVANLMSGDAEDYSPQACAPGSRTIDGLVLRGVRGPFNARAGGVRTADSDARRRVRKWDARNRVLAGQRGTRRASFLHRYLQ
jgi:hypothetical protein